MKRLCIVRHAKSDWSDPGGDDHDRPLNQRGQRAAAAVAVWLRQRNVRPDQILCSTARRARETLGYLRERLEGDPAIHEERGLYLARPDQLAERLEAVDEEADCVVLIGHNPGLEELVAWLDPDAGDSRRLPTAAVALFRLRVDSWKDLARGAAELEKLVFPKQLL